MTANLDPAPIQEPGIGGPVDLAGIARYRKVRVIAVLLLTVAMLAAVVAGIGGWMDWLEVSFLRQPRASSLVYIAYVSAFLVLMAAEAGNRTETWLAGLGALWATVTGVLVAVGCGALLAHWAPDWPVWLLVIVPLLAGYAVILPPGLCAAWMAHRRYKRLIVRAKEEAQS